MNKILIIFGIWIAFLALARAQIAEPCPSDPERCKLPTCLCSKTNNSKNFDPKEIPQLVTLTFDDAVTTTNYEFYNSLFERKNPNGASIGVTYFVTHDYNDYSFIHQLFRRHHEIALHSITHQVNTTYWSSLDVEGWRSEVVDQIEQLAILSKVARPLLKGFRAPFLQTGGNAMYEALSASSLQWESSMPTIAHRKPGLFPYTNDFASIQDCQIAPCRNHSFPGFWTFPMIAAMGGNGFSCSMMDTCIPTPVTAQDTFDLLKINFEDHYNTEDERANRAPFGIFIHYAWIADAQRLQGLNDFLDYLHTLPDVYMTTVSNAIEWSKNPVLAKDITPATPSYLAVRNVLPDGCAVKNSCRYEDVDVPNGGERYMTICVPCPPKYPWLNNHLGNLTLLEEYQYI